MAIDDVRRFKPLLDIMGNPEFYIRRDPVLDGPIMDNRQSKVMEAQTMVAQLDKITKIYNLGDVLITAFYDVNFACRKGLL